MTQTIEQTTTTQAERIFSAMKDLESKARELKAAIKTEETESAPNFPALVAWQAEVSMIEGRRLPPLRAEYETAIKQSKAVEVEALRAALVTLAERQAPLGAQRMALKPDLEQAIHTAWRNNSTWPEVARLAKLYGAVVEEYLALDVEAKAISSRLYDMERGR